MERLYPPGASGHLNHSRGRTPRKATVATSDRFRMLDYDTDERSDPVPTE